MSKRTKGTALQAYFNIKYNLPMNRVKQIWEAQEKAYREMMEDEQYCHPESFRWGFEQGVDWSEKDTIERAWEWMTSAKGEQTFEDFRKAMEKE